MLEINPDALDIANELDQQRRRGTIHGYDRSIRSNEEMTNDASPLHGLPILIKDNIAINDRLNTTGRNW